MRKMQALIGLSILLGLLVTACSPSAPPAEPTPLPPTQAPAATAAAVFEPLSVSAGCESGSIIQEIAALDQKNGPVQLVPLRSGLFIESGLHRFCDSAA
jgi:hypothetical protein